MKGHTWDGAFAQKLDQWLALGVSSGSPDGCVEHFGRGCDKAIETREHKRIDMWRLGQSDNQVIRPSCS